MPSYGHSLSRLLLEVGRVFKCEDDVVQAAKTLDKYYVPTRYPNAWVEGVPDEYYTRKDAVRFAERIIFWIEERWRSLKRGGE